MNQCGLLKAARKAVASQALLQDFDPGVSCGGGRYCHSTVL